VVRLVAAHFVPVALNTDRLPDTAAGNFFRKLMSRWPQGLWVVTPAGETLAFHYHKQQPGDNYARNQQRWADDTVAMLKEAVAKLGDVPPRRVPASDPFPDRGVGLSAEGGVRLAVSVIGLRNGNQEGPPAVDSVRLTAAEWAAFAPPAGQSEWTIPVDAGKRFAPALSPLTDSIFVPRPADVTAATISARVAREGEGAWVIRYRGKWESKHNRDGNPKFPIRAMASGEGVGVYDPAAKRLRSLVWVLTGTYRNGSQATPTASVIEWVQK
jgi:hypothetical protein